MPEPAPPNRKRRSIPSFSEGISTPKGQASEDGKIYAPCVIRGVRAAKSAPSWQDLRAVYPPTAICGAFRMHGAHILPKPAHFEYTAAICCHELAIFPSEATFGMRGAQNLSRIAARERISRAFCHRQAPGNAPHEYIATASQAKSASGRNPAIVERLGNAYSQRLANGAASSCGWAYCLAIALVPHESDDLFVQAVLCTRERGTLSRTWRGALNAGIRAEGADDKLAHALHPNRLAPFAQAGLRPSPRVDRNIDVRRGTNPQVKRTSSACARLN